MAPIKSVIISAQTIANAAPERFPDEKVGGTVHWKTLLSAPDTPTDTFTAGIATCTGSSNSSSSRSLQNSPSPTASSKPIPTCAFPSSGHLNLHRHSHPELYYIISGSGIVTIEGKEHMVVEGSVVFIPGDAEHGVRSTGEQDLRWLYVFSAGGFGEVVYRFSKLEEEEMGKKIGVRARL